MTPKPHTPPPIPQCAVCKERPAQGIAAGVLVCAQCFEEAQDDAIRLYRFSLKVVKGGLPR